MSEPAPDLSTGNASRAEHPKVFTRLFTVPQGAPWEQARAAQLEARHGSPMPIADLFWRVRRLEAWGPRKPVRYAAFYVRRNEVSGQFETSVNVEGRSFPLAFGTSGVSIGRVSEIAVLTIVSLIVVSVATSGVLMASNSRNQLESEVSRAELRLKGKLRQLADQQKRLERQRELARLVGGSAPAQDILADLAWTASARLPEARIQAFHWDKGLIAIETRGDATPLAAAGRSLERSSKPLRPGVWLWGVSDPQPATLQ